MIHDNVVNNLFLVTHLGVPEIRVPMSPVPLMESVLLPMGLPAVLVMQVNYDNNFNTGQRIPCSRVDK